MSTLTHEAALSQIRRQIKTVKEWRTSAATRSTLFGAYMYARGFVDALQAAHAISWKERNAFTEECRIAYGPEGEEA